MKKIVKRKEGERKEERRKKTMVYKKEKSLFFPMMSQSSSYRFVCLYFDFLFLRLFSLSRSNLFFVCLFVC